MIQRFIPPEKQLPDLLYLEDYYRCYVCGGFAQRAIKLREKRDHGVGKIIKYARVCNKHYEANLRGFPVGADIQSVFKIPKQLSNKMVEFLKQQKEEAEKKVNLAKEKQII